MKNKSDIVTAIAALGMEWGGSELLDTMIAGGIEGDPDALEVLSGALKLREELRPDIEAESEGEMAKTSFPITADIDDTEITIDMAKPPGDHAGTRSIGMSSPDMLELITHHMIRRLNPKDLEQLHNRVGRLMGEDPELRKNCLAGGPAIVLSLREREWMQGVKTNENPTGVVKKINAIKSLRWRMREKYGFEMLLKDAKEFVEEYEAMFRAGTCDILDADQRNEWVKTGKTPDEIISEEVQRMLNTELPPWKHDEAFESQYTEALTELERSLGWHTGEIVSLAQEYYNRATRSEFKILAPRTKPVVDESTIVDIHEDILLEDE